MAFFCLDEVTNTPRRPLGAIFCTGRRKDTTQGYTDPDHPEMLNCFNYQVPSLGLSVMWLKHKISVKLGKYSAILCFPILCGWWRHILKPFSSCCIDIVTLPRAILLARCPPVCDKWTCNHKGPEIRISWWWSLKGPIFFHTNLPSCRFFPFEPQHCQVELWELQKPTSENSAYAGTHGFSRLHPKVGGLTILHSPGAWTIFDIHLMVATPSTMSNSLPFTLATFEAPLT